MKPRIYFQGGVWRCEGNNVRGPIRFVCAWGFTPVGAYNMWRTLAN